VHDLIRSQCGYATCSPRASVREIAIEERRQEYRKAYRGTGTLAKRQEALGWAEWSEPFDAVYSGTCCLCGEAFPKGAAIVRRWGANANAYAEQRCVTDLDE
jgi:hypothetical protein